MAKSSKKKKSQSVSIDGIYEMLKEKKFTKDLWLDLLSDLKEKPTYKRMKEMVASVITDKLKDYEQKPSTNAEHSQKRAALTEISILAYTIDRVVSEVLYKKLENELKSLIANMLNEFQNKPSKQTKSVENKASLGINAMLENIESIFTEKPVKGKGKIAKSPESSINDLMAQNFARKRGRPPLSKTDCSKISADKEKGNESDGNLSLSISSVGTDDLSSFDDNVSVCTDEGNVGERKKKIVPLQAANTMIVEGKISKIYQIQKRAKKIKGATQNQKVPSKILPRRKRKPNSKYNSETMYCNVKDYSSDRSSFSDPTSDVPDIPSQILQKAKRFKTDSVEMRKKTDNVEVKKIPPINVVSTRSANSSSSSDKSSSDASEYASPTKTQNTTKRYDTADLYKPRFHFGKS